MSVIAAVVALVAVVIALEPRRNAAPPPLPPGLSSDVPAAIAPADDETNSRRPAPPAARPAPEPPAYIENLVWGEIDLREAQAVMPDNLYWQLGAPTSDPDVLAAREEDKRRRNDEYGRVLAGDADEEEVDAYYDYRERLSSDYLEFSEWMKNRYGEALPEQMRGLLDLSIKLHTARLAQLASEREGALEHSRERAKIRADWKHQQEEFSEFR